MTSKNYSESRSDFVSESEENKDLYQYIASKVELSKNISIKVVKALEEYILLELSRNKEFKLNRVGTFKLLVGKTGRTVVKFKASYKLILELREIKGGYKHSLESAINIIKERKLTPEEEEADRLVSELCNDLRTGYIDKELLEKKVKHNYLRYNFLCYLQRDFVFKRNWVHPDTKEEIEWTKIRGGLIFLKEYDAEGYRIVYIMWVSIEYRELLVKRWGYDTKWMVDRLYKTVDMLFTVLLHPELIPKELEIKIDSIGRFNGTFKRNQFINNKK